MRRAATRLLLGRLGGPSAALPGAVEEAGAAVRVTTSSAVAAERSGLHGPAAAAAATAARRGPPRPTAWPRSSPTASTGAGQACAGGVLIVLLLRLRLLHAWGGPSARMLVPTLPASAAGDGNVRAGRRVRRPRR